MKNTNFSKPFLTPSQLLEKWGKVLRYNNTDNKNKSAKVQWIEPQEHWIKTPDKLDDKQE